MTLPLLSFVWPPGLPLGDYIFFLAFLREGALDDNVLEAREVPVVAADTATYGP